MIMASTFQERAIRLIESLTEETLTVTPQDPENPETGWVAKLETIGPATVAYGKDAIDALSNLWKRCNKNSY